jgi:ThiF family
LDRFAVTVTREQFETQFYSRTLAYLPGLDLADRPLLIVAGPKCHTPAGHALLVSLTNLAARAHRSIIFAGALDQPVLCRTVARAGSLAQATLDLARAINPFIDVDYVGENSISGVDALLTVGIGTEATVELALGCDGWLAHLDRSAPVGQGEDSIWGALLASCLGANVALHRMLGTTELPFGTTSLWDYARQGNVQGPRESQPLDVGRVLQVGAGAVGAALDFFLSFAGIAGHWTIVDGDLVEVSNLNRQLLFNARDAGFPDGEAINKAMRAAEALGAAATYSPVWFHEDEKVVEGKYDLVLALANDYGVRSALQHRQPTVLLHATTSRSWQAQLHRHVAGWDDCIDCRLPPGALRFTCSTEDVQAPSGEHFDAAIPPISAVAGLLLAAELVKLQHGSIVEEPFNFTAVELSKPTVSIQRKIRRCRDTCGVIKLAPLRQSLNAGSRWIHLDRDYQEQSP